MPQSLHSERHRNNESRSGLEHPSPHPLSRGRLPGAYTAECQELYEARWRSRPYRDPASQYLAPPEMPWRRWLCPLQNALWDCYGSASNRGRETWLLRRATQGLSRDRVVSRPPRRNKKRDSNG